MPNTNDQKAVTLANMEALKDVLATNDNVKKQISEAQLAGSGVEFATDEEVLALFQETPTEPTE